MTLKYAPFAASTQLTALDGGAAALRKGKRGAGVRLIQGGLLDLGYKMPRSLMKSAVPDGIFGTETTQAVSKFQTTEKLGVDGLVGKAKGALDDVAAVGEASASWRSSAAMSFTKLAPLRHCPS